MTEPLRKNDILASTLLLLSTACYLASGLLFYKASLTSFATLFALALYAFLLIALSRGLRVGRQWARIILLTYTVWVIYTNVYSYYQQLNASIHSSSAENILSTLSAVLQVWAAIIVAKGLFAQRSATTVKQA